MSSFVWYSGPPPNASAYAVAYKAIVLFSISLLGVMYIYLYVKSGIYFFRDSPVWMMPALGRRGRHRHSNLHTAWYRQHHDFATTYYSRATRRNAYGANRSPTSKHTQRIRVAWACLIVPFWPVVFVWTVVWNVLLLLPYKLLMRTVCYVRAHREPRGTPIHKNPRDAHTCGYPTGRQASESCRNCGPPAVLYRVLCALERLVENTAYQGAYWLRTKDGCHALLIAATRRQHELHPPPVYGAGPHQQSGINDENQGANDATPGNNGDVSINMNGTAQEWPQGVPLVALQRPRRARAPRNRRQHPPPPYAGWNSPLPPYNDAVGPSAVNPDDGSNNQDVNDERGAEDSDGVSNADSVESNWSGYLHEAAGDTCRSRRNSEAVAIELRALTRIPLAEAIPDTELSVQPAAAVPALSETPVMRPVADRDETMRRAYQRQLATLDGGPSSSRYPTL
ncbi:hypothetical protein SPI_06524 [Niveomyces insectorum RCEF 264]|uniref:Uncharacterized protein n=1 Tax=Niveomyces insectorum RCEF 264 TaxID=1081102 RepID=A0A167RBV9_9HYPO|nr:hypothetical protein SPI_06524 [Niveomyces insectorum RCEF 264]